MLASLKQRIQTFFPMSLVCRQVCIQDVQLEIPSNWETGYEDEIIQLFWCLFLVFAFMRY